MNLSVIEEFFEVSFHQNGSIYSLEFISNKMIYYVELEPSSNSMMFTASNEDMKPLCPLFSYELLCDNVTVTTESNGFSELNFFISGQPINTVSIKKELDAFSIIVNL